MKRFNYELRVAYNNAGYRERFAMDNGKKLTCFVAGNKCYKFVYSEDVEYQDANGATYDTIRKSWIG